MKALAFASWTAGGLIQLSALAGSAVHYKPAMSASSTLPSIDGTYELSERVTANGTVLRPPSIAALYTNADGRFNLNLFVKKDDGAVASESTMRMDDSTFRHPARGWRSAMGQRDLPQPSAVNLWIIGRRSNKENCP